MTVRLAPGWRTGAFRWIFDFLRESEPCDDPIAGRRYWGGARSLYREKEKAR
ncbi:hypothetical protein NEPTK9_000986 [Candidatus Neptunochlamydia vexilliferae]|uniref:Uncharacterized protein n=1 Tax=Candidatus Neptunichlamydia vexilliferae TaxID=1651774 RepID=A0ABS0AZC6_9BACT|nr:hypothetical protein [Candidatus Neptunochlamydia vexilliferae]